MLRIRHIDAFGFPILHVKGALDLTSFGKLMTEITHCLEQRPHHLGLDLSEVTHADTAAITVVATTAEWMAEHGGKLHLLDTSPAFEKALQESSAWLCPHSQLEVYHAA